jgi:predicted aspartyl protease
MLITRIVAAFLSCLALAGADAHAECAPDRLSTVKAAFLPDGRITVPVMVEGHPLSFLLDTGGANTTIKWDLAREMGLAVQQTPRRLKGVAGSILNFVLAGDNFSVGELPMKNKPIYVESRALPGADGTLGANTLRSYDVEIDMTDMTRASVSLFSSGYCALPEWLGSPVAIDISRGGHVHVPVKIDGIPLVAMLDTGAATSVISLRAAARLGVRPNSPELRLAGSTGPYRVYAYPFQSLALGGLVVKNPRIAIASDGLIPGNDLVLGIDALHGTRFTIAYGSNRLYIKGPQGN